MGQGDIPQDVWDAALELWGVLFTNRPSDIEEIARAILAERERCANIAEGLGRVGFALNEGESKYGDFIARCIRQPDNDNFASVQHLGPVS
jgi:hypothetical protein